MEYIINLVTGALSVGWVGSVLGIVGLIVAALTYLATRQRTKLAFAHSSQRLLGHKDEGLPQGISVKFMGADIPRLSRSILAIWNEGEKTIHQSDLVPADPLRISVGQDGKILTVTTLDVSRDVNRISFNIGINGPHEVLIAFDFLDQHDGAVVEILHTSENRTAKVLGTVRGLPRGVSDYGVLVTKSQFERKLPVLKYLKPKYLGYFTIAIGCAFAILGYFDVKPPARDFDGDKLIYVAAAMYIVLGGALVWLIRRKHPKTLSIEDV